MGLDKGFCHSLATFLFLCLKLVIFQFISSLYFHLPQHRLNVRLLLLLYTFFSVFAQLMYHFRDFLTYLNLFDCYLDTLKTSFEVLESFIGMKFHCNLKIYSFFVITIALLLVNSVHSSVYSCYFNLLHTFSSLNPPTLFLTHLHNLRIMQWNHP